MNHVFICEILQVNASTICTKPKWVENISIRHVHGYLCCDKMKIYRAKLYSVHNMIHICIHNKFDKLLLKLSIKVKYIS